MPCRQRERHQQSIIRLNPQLRLAAGARYFIDLGDIPIRCFSQRKTARSRTDQEFRIQPCKLPQYQNESKSVCQRRNDELSQQRQGIGETPSIVRAVNEDSDPRGNGADHQNIRCKRPAAMR
jgi:hypothetical protein